MSLTLSPVKANTMSTEFKKHNLIPQHLFELLVTHVKDIDNALSSHFIQHTTIPKVQDILEQASKLNAKRPPITRDEFEIILRPKPRLYNIYWNGNDYHISFPSVKETDRIGEYIEALNKWIENNPKEDIIEQIPLFHIRIVTRIPMRVTESMKKITKPQSSSSLSSPTSSPTKRKADFVELKNTRSKFTFKEKNAAEESEKNQGMSLLERIRKKEASNKEQFGVTKQEKHDRYLSSKMGQIYSVICQLYYDAYPLKGNNGKVFKILLSLNKIVQVVRDTCDENLMDQDDILRIIEMISDRLDSFQIHNVSGTIVLCVSELNRLRDLAVLETKVIGHTYYNKKTRALGIAK